MGRGNEPYVSCTLNPTTSPLNSQFPPLLSSHISLLHFPQSQLFFNFHHFNKFFTNFKGYLSIFSILIG
ncbi:hypothetical protein L1887_32783 [Cichorium endivia]|nr:hypothetical protein L1887_32783 [Cichorium endivia]